MKLSRTMSISKILKDLCPVRQKIRRKNTFADTVYSFLIVKSLART